MASDMKCAVVILDGASGDPLACFHNKTTLQAARTPHLDKLAVSGLVGLSRNVPAGLEASSNVACTSIVGYNPVDYPIGRGALEAAGLGVDLKPGQVALRLNLCTVSDDGIMESYSAGNISNEDSHAIADELSVLDDDTFRLVKGTGFRHILVVTGHPELMETTFTAPHNITDMPVENAIPEGPGAQLIIDYQRRADAILRRSPVNARLREGGHLSATNVWVFWPGIRPAGMQPFESIYHKKCAMLTAVDLLDGIAMLAGIRRYHFEGVTDGADNDYAAQGEGALSMLEENDVVIIHIEAPDAAGHDGDAAAKRAAIEAIDREIMSRLVTYGKTHLLRILALPDHPTPVTTKRHSYDPVPFVLSGPGIEANGGTRLTEKEGRATGVLIDPGCNLMGRLISP